MSRNIGYARVSKGEQNIDRQLDALKKKGCEIIFQDHFTGRTMNRSGFNNMFNIIEPSDKLIVWETNRIGRCLLESCQSVADIILEKKARIISVQENLDSKKHKDICLMVFHLISAYFGVIAISDNTKSGLAAAKRRGKKLGRRNALSDDKKISLFKELDKEKNNEEYCLEKYLKKFGISKSTYHNYRNELLEKGLI